MAAMLVLALLLTSGLALVAFQAERDHRDTTRAVLGGYADLASQELAARVLQELSYYGATPLFNFLGPRVALWEPGQQLPTPADAAESPRLSNAAELATAFFRIGTDGSVVVGGELPAGWAEWLHDTIPAHEAADTVSSGATVLLGPGALGSPLAYYLSYDERPLIFGFVSDSARLRQAISRGLARGALLPEPLLRGHPGDSLAAIAVVTRPGGSEIFRFEAGEASDYTAATAVDGPLSQISASVTLRSSFAGLVGSDSGARARLNVLLVTFLMAAAMLAAALVLWRREQQLIRLRSDFVSGVSHELRTPLAQIRMFAETLLLGRVRSGEERSRSLSIIDQEARRLTHLVENLLYFSRRERNLTKVDPQRGALAPAVLATVSAFRPLAEARGNSVVTEADPDVEATIDPDGIHQLLLNLLDNAVKYGPHDQRITVRVREVHGRPRLEVEDEGPGIPAAERHLIWQRFWRASGHRDSAISGTGIGLAIVRELAELQGAVVRVEAGAKGALFVIEWPGEAASGSAAPSRQGRAGSPVEAGGTA